MDELYSVIAGIIEARREEGRINASWVANEALKVVDPERVSVTCVYNGCLEHAKQHARGLLGKKFDKVENNDPQFELFTELQWRYPVRPERGIERSYVLLEQMTEDDVDYNEQRFLSAAEEFGKHARALRAWWNGRRKSA